MSPERAPSSALVESIRKGLIELESIGRMRAASNNGMSQFLEHMEGKLLQGKARQLQRELDQLEKKFNV